MTLLKVENLHVDIDGKSIIRGVDLEISENELHIIMGPNGSGKSTLLSAIMGMPWCRVVKGRIIFNDKDITYLPMYERAKLGIALAHQFPPSIKGLLVKDLIKALEVKYGKSSQKLLKHLDVDYLVSRYLFTGFSGGERKRMELYLTVLQKPKLALLDEPDSGVDVDTLRKISQTINDLVSSGVSVILVTHVGSILNMLKHVDKVYILINGKIVKSGDLKLAHEVLVKGYQAFLSEHHE